MADRANIPSSPACGLWETLLADALDGLLKPGDEAWFSEHMAGCPACTALFEEARRGREWLKYLVSEPEVPAGLLDKILAKTGPGKETGLGLAAGPAGVLPVSVGFIPASTPAWQRPGLAGAIRRFAEPRLLMTAAMAFFSIALTLNLTGVRLTNFHLADLRPAAVRSFMERRLTTASVPIVRYYDHLRFVYEVESRMRELRRTTEGEGQGTEDNTPKQNEAQPAAPGESRQNPIHKDGGSRVAPPQQSPAHNDPIGFLEATLTFHQTSRAFRRLQNGTTGTTAQKRSTTWTA